MMEQEAITVIPLPDGTVFTTSNDISFPVIKGADDLKFARPPVEPNPEIDAAVATVDVAGEEAAVSVSEAPEAPEEVEQEGERRVRVSPVQPRRAGIKTGANAPCPCGAVNSATGKRVKYKKCCMSKEL